MKSSASSPAGDPAASVTRFAPSPTGQLHSGNRARRCSNLLLARRAGGRFILRIEDTDAERSSEGHSAELMQDLRWLGIDWDAVRTARTPGALSAVPARQPLRSATSGCSRRRGGCIRATARRWSWSSRDAPSSPRDARRVMPARLPRAISRRARAAAPRKDSPRRCASACTCAESASRLSISCTGPQSFLSDDIGDFVIRRADGSAAFFFSNARSMTPLWGSPRRCGGEDHLTNTPRQLLILAALGLAAPAYGHVSLIVGVDGARSPSVTAR